jgi:hypothetical protein
MCSSWIEEYQIGNSKPWKSTIFAPSDICDSYNAVLTREWLMQLAGVRRWKNNSDDEKTVSKATITRV